MDKKLNILHTSINGVFIIKPIKFEDERGSFSRLFCIKELEKISNIEIKQINHSVSKYKGTVRGLHFQEEPYAEIKIIKCLKGSVFDVIVDIRKNSPTFLKTFSIKLTSKNQKMIYIPKGFAHGFQTLEDNVELLYFHSNVYTPKKEGALNIKDPLLNIKWPENITFTSEKDARHSFLNTNFKGIEINEM
jgi:dTDP-4-dehydrorhamnose 3,5-epimerase